MKSFVKNTLKIILPAEFLNFLKKKKIRISTIVNLFQGYKYDFEQYYKFSDTNGSDTATKLIGEIIRKYHIIEKGLTMPYARLGFGKEIVISLCNNCELFLFKYGKEEEQLIHAIGVLLEYKNFHETKNFLLDAIINSSIQNIVKNTPEVIRSKQKEMTKSKYFSNSESPFALFSNSRISIRNFASDEVGLDKILYTLELARNTPSACNRQSWRTYIYTDKELIGRILHIQGGNRGFGHLTNKLILITGEIGVFYGQDERNQVLIDGGMYTMNVLYGLHYTKIGACVLNCSNSVEKDKQLRIACKIRKSEVFIAMISCGIPPESFMAAASKRYSVDKTNTIIDCEKVD